MEILRAENLVKVYKTESDEVVALKGVNISLKEGEFSLLMGASGSGKSTLLHILGTLDRPTEGKVYYREREIFTLPEREIATFRNRKVGFVFQFHYLIGELSLLENVMVPLLIGGVSEREARIRAEEVLKSVGLGHRLSHKPFEVSGGEKQRAAVARALVTNPEVVLADEPTGNLDSQASHSVLSLMKELNRELGTTFLIATHNRELETYADRIYFIKDGVIVS
ncbi:putative ABC transport system ATP-binding protein/lipoprotein-releasing system ATP-binding protein [Balnearium lithotrophicum]|uniref:Putative ABC transport system ATP-binding protein/lipoprotein-releasing system ATP-binding protein n=1 Tax=Balnearium lithotrophicum TaxID=223788 RepID=A0A521CGV0_9BACT|nr:putative ABC transport system ATP-binding protein/lipoprotein-releasing system ATP-binding protein [Balnearium lithotrophicum]